jgi:acyl carrier protein
MRNRSRSSQSDKAVGGDTASRLASVFADVLRLPLDQVHPGLRPEDVERWDSVNHLALVLAIEQEFSIQCEVDEIMEFTSFQAILSAIEPRMASARPVGAGERIGT